MAKKRETVTVVKLLPYTVLRILAMTVSFRLMMTHFDQN